ncbi:MAG: hypothetical protein WC279_12675 [Sulfurimonas sp.]|uniref:hypothetical protein n=1 Tax=Sulfurimonas sp. TaxID=2022749 RepID=UPI0035689CB9
MNSMTYDGVRQGNLPERKPVIITGQEIIKTISYTPVNTHVMPAATHEIPLQGMNRIKLWFNASGAAMPAGATLTFFFYRDDKIPDGRTRRSVVGNVSGYVMAVPAVPAGTTSGIDFVDQEGLLPGATTVKVVLSGTVDMGVGTGSIVAGLFYAAPTGVTKKFETVGVVAAGDAEDTTYNYYVDLRAVSSLGLQLILVPGATGTFEVTVDGTLNSDAGPEDFAEAMWQDITGDIFSGIEVDPPVITESAILADDFGVSRTLAYLRVNVTVATSDAATAFEIIAVKS